MKPIYTMRRWAIVGHNHDPYTPPEIRFIRLQGDVYGRSAFYDGDNVTTSRVVGADGRRIETANSIYVLEGPPHEGYVEFCRRNGIEIDPENPIKVIQ